MFFLEIIEIVLSSEGGDFELMDFDVMIEFHCDSSILVHVVSKYILNKSENATIPYLMFCEKVFDKTHFAKAYYCFPDIQQMIR